jgi:phage baseplate assembly protein V
MTETEDIPADLSTLIRYGRVATVTYDPPRVTVRYGNPEDEGGGAVTPPIRWAHVRSGRTRSWSPPSEGEEVIVLAPGGQIGAAVALCGLTNEDHPPAGTGPETVDEYEDGARIGYDAQAHALTAILPAGATAVVEAPGGLTIRGPVRFEGDVDFAGDSVTHGGVNIGKGHHHGGVQPGSGTTGTPT